MILLRGNGRARHSLLHPAGWFGAQLTKCIRPTRLTARSDRSLSENRDIGVLLSVRTL